MIYDFKFWEELGRAVAVAVISAAAAAVYSQGVPTTRAAIASMLIGLVPVFYAAVRAAFTKASTPPATPPTPITPPATGI